jgi:hypothetical protein
VIGQAADHRDQGEVELRCLADYDAAFGLDSQGVAQGSGVL